METTNEELNRAVTNLIPIRKQFNNYLGLLEEHKDRITVLS